MNGDFGLGAMTGILPVIVVAGVATKMTESMFDRTRQYEEERPRRTTRRRVRRRYPLVRSTGMSFGNFSNIGL